MDMLRIFGKNPAEKKLVCASAKTRRLGVLTVASEKDDQMSETMSNDKNLPNPHLFEPLFYSRA